MTFTLSHGRFRLKFFVGLRFALRMIGKSKGKDKELKQEFAEHADEIAAAIKAYKKICGKFVLFEATDGKSAIKLTV